SAFRQRSALAEQVFVGLKPLLSLSDIATGPRNKHIRVEVYLDDPIRLRIMHGGRNDCTYRYHPSRGCWLGQPGARAWNEQSAEQRSGSRSTASAADQGQCPGSAV